jgi:hypothetical protein
VRVKGSVVVAESRRALWTAAYICVIAAVICVAGLTLAGQPRIGVALAAGLMIGAASGPLALRSLASGLPYSTVSMTRLMVQSAIALGVGYALGTDVIWIPMLGVAGALAILAFVAVRGVIASR